MATASMLVANEEGDPRETLLDLLQSVHAQGLQEGFAECREQSEQALREEFAGDSQIIWYSITGRERLVKTIRALQPPREEKG